jgi:predicted nucleic-acid-binding protein
MIGIDTNILLRLWLNDDPAQAKRIDALSAAHGRMPGLLLVTDVFLVKAVWTLKSAFEQNKSAQLIAVRSLLEETAFAFEDREVVAAALGLFEAGSCGFADCLVVAKHARQGCEFTATLVEACASCRGSRCADLNRPRTPPQACDASHRTPRRRLHPPLFTSAAGALAPSDCSRTTRWQTGQASPCPQRPI